MAVFAIGGMFGGVLCGFAADRFGRYEQKKQVIFMLMAWLCRKGAMLLNNVIAIVAAVLMGISKTTNVFPLLIVGRFLIGFNCGKSWYACRIEWLA